MNQALDIDLPRKKCSSLEFLQLQDVCVVFLYFSSATAVGKISFRAAANAQYGGEACN